MKRRNLLSSLSVLTALSLFGAGSAYAADIYPSKPLLTIVPFSAGGGNDILLRIMGKYAEKHLFDKIDEVNVRDGDNYGNTDSDFGFSVWTTIEE